MKMGGSVALCVAMLPVILERHCDVDSVKIDGEKGCSRKTEYI